MAMVQWEQRDAPLDSEPRACHTMTACGNTLYIISGRRGDNHDETMTAFHTDTGIWDPPDRLPFPARQLFATILIGRELWVVGGSALTKVFSDVWTFDTATLAWTERKIKGPVHLLKRTGHAAARNPLKPEEIFIFGGMGSTLEKPNLTLHLEHMVVLDTKRCTVKRIMPKGGKVPAARTHHTLCAVGSHLMLYGGRGHFRDPPPEPHLAIYSITNKSWETVEALHAEPTPRSGHVAITWHDSMVIFGGSITEEVKNRFQSTRALQRNDNGHWLWHGQLDPAVGMRPVAREGAAVALVGSRMFISGGYRGNRQYMADLWALPLEEDAPPRILPSPATRRWPPSTSAKLASSEWKMSNRSKRLRCDSQLQDNNSANLITTGTTVAAAAAGSHQRAFAAVAETAAAAQARVDVALARAAAAEKAEASERAGRVRQHAALQQELASYRQTIAVLEEKIAECELQHREDRERLRAANQQQSRCDLQLEQLTRQLRDANKSTDDMMHQRDAQQLEVENSKVKATSVLQEVAEIKSQYLKFQALSAADAARLSEKLQISEAALEQAHTQRNVFLQERDALQGRLNDTLKNHNDALVACRAETAEAVSQLAHFRQSADDSARAAADGAQIMQRQLADWEARCRSTQNQQVAAEAALETVSARLRDAEARAEADKAERVRAEVQLAAATREQNRLHIEGIRLKADKESIAVDTTRAVSSMMAQLQVIKQRHTEG